MTQNDDKPRAPQFTLNIFDSIDLAQPQVMELLQSGERVSLFGETNIGKVRLCNLHAAAQVPTGEQWALSKLYVRTNVNHDDELLRLLFATTATLVIGSMPITSPLAMSELFTWTTWSGRSLYSVDPTCADQPIIPERQVLRVAVKMDVDAYREYMSRRKEMSFRLPIVRVHLEGASSIVDARWAARERSAQLA